MTNEEKRSRIEELESRFLSEATAEKFPEMAEALLACDRLYFSYASRCLSGSAENGRTEIEPKADPDTAPWVERSTEADTEAEVVPADEPKAAEPDPASAPAESYPKFSEVRGKLIDAANTKGVDVKACLTTLGYEKLSDVPENKYRELLKLAGVNE